MEGKAKTEQSSQTIVALYLEDRRFDPPPAFRQRAVVSDESLYEKARKDLEGFWAEQAESLLRIRLLKTPNDQYHSGER